MNRKIIVLTGASDDIGVEAARQFHAKGATVVIVGRSSEKTKAIADFSTLSDVRKGAREYWRAIWQPCLTEPLMVLSRPSLA